MQLQRADCTVLPDDVAVEVKDPRGLRRFLSNICDQSSSSAVTLAETAQAYLRDDTVLLAVLQPMTVLQRVCLLNPFVVIGTSSCCPDPKLVSQGLPETSDSLVRLLLNLPKLQTALSCFLLERLSSWRQATDNEEDPSKSLAFLVLGSLRWYAVDRPCISYTSIGLQ